MSSRCARPADASKRPTGRRILVGMVALASAMVGCGTREAPRLEVVAVAEGEPGGGARIASRLRIRNVGGRALLLYDVAPACSCALGGALPDSLAPGEEAGLVVSCRGVEDGGAPTVRVLSNDPVRPDQRVALHAPADTAPSTPGAMPKHPASAMPAVREALYFGYVPVGQSATRELVLRPGGPAAGPRTEPSAGAGRDDTVPAPPPALEDVPSRAHDPAVSVEPPTHRADGTTAYTIRFTPRTAGPVRSTLELARVPPISTIGVGYRSVIVFPAEVILPAARGRGRTTTIALHAIGESPVEITDLELPNGLAGTVHTVEAGREFRLVVHATPAAAGLPAAAPGATAGTGGAIRVHTSAADEPLVVIPVRSADDS